MHAVLRVVKDLEALFLFCCYESIGQTSMQKVKCASLIKWANEEEA